MTVREKSDFIAYVFSPHEADLLTRTYRSSNNNKGAVSNRIQPHYRVSLSSAPPRGRSVTTGGALV